ncbi:DUF4888 domain-containing protein [Staphylococcus aureus]
MNTKFLGKTLVASALVLTTLGTGLHSSYLGLDTNKVIKTAKAEENMTKTDLWKGIKHSLIDANIISGNEHESVKISYILNNGQSTNFESTANHDTFTNEPSQFSKLTQIDIEKTNIRDLDARIDANLTWKKLTQKLKEQNLVNNGDTVSIHSKDKNDPLITAKVGEDYNEHKQLMPYKKDIDKITIN